MMKAGNRTVTTCRKDDGELVVTDSSFVSVRKKHKFLNIPILRGVVNFIEMMALSVKTLNISAEALGIEDEDGRVERWMKKHLGLKLTDVIMIVALVLGLALALVLFKFLPALAADGVDYLTTTLFDFSIGRVGKSLTEGIIKIAIFLLYLWGVSLLPDIKRTFMYHGAEHKSIACFEAGDELTPENAAKHKRFHPRCGTSFMFLMIGLGVVFSLCIRLAFQDLTWYTYLGISLLTLPLTMGVGYEILMIAGKHDNILTRIISTPGLWVQRLTTKEPTADMLEVAITSIKCALRDDFPEFKEFYVNKEWKKVEESSEIAEVIDEEGATNAEDNPIQPETTESTPTTNEPEGDAQ